MKKTYSLGKRLLAMIVTLALVLTFMPNVALSANAAIAVDDMVQGSKKVDPYTIHNWKQYFDIMSTEYVGGVWSDKSVFNSFDDYSTAEGVNRFVGPNGTAITNDVKEMLATDPANFLVTMSAITANKSISGSASTPMDTMLVLDVSGSMQGDNAVAVVEATNRAIKTLLDQNVNNRIGVILYSGNHQQGDSETSSASVLLPLGRYTTTNTMTVGRESIPAYLTISGSGNNQTVRVASSVNNGNATDAKTVRGGTYIQNGLYQAWQQFNAVSDVKVPAGLPQAGAQRTPVIVLMSDGAPTAATTDYNAVGESNLGDGMDTTNRIGFMTQLTAAYVRGRVNTKYGTSPKFYTLGVGTGNDSIATSVVNPASSNRDLTNYWNSFDAGTVGRNVQIVSGSWGQSGWSVYKDAAVQGKNYVDQYWLTNNAAGLINAFNQIVNTIVLESEQYSTLVDMTQGAELSGYVTFEDELGELMEVKSVKGITIGNKIFTGAELAKGMDSGVLGTVDGPTAAGDELVRTVKERMGIAETSVAQTLIDNAYNAGQLSYTSATEYSNYIGWYADENGKYVGFWQESDGYTADNAPKDAKYINKSYGYLGEPLTQDGAGSDMMHIVVMVHTEIATGRQSVVYKIPAALLPSVTYHVELNGENIEDPESMTRDGADPMRLLFEVGLRSDINPVNIAEKVAEYDALEGTHIHANDDGTYTFYTNRWGSGDGKHEVDYNEPMSHLVTEAHFNPALENDRYYHVEDDLVYADQNGTVYAGTTRPTAGYFARPYYELDGNAVKYTVEYAPINGNVLLQAQPTPNASTWYIPEGTPHSLERFALAKDPNETDTLNYSWNPVILHDSEGYHSYTFLGNNGTFTIAPAQGLSITKTVTEKVDGASGGFEFVITLDRTVPSGLKVTDADGNDHGARVTGNEIRVILADGETVVISGLETGTTYTVTETADGYYTPTITGATGTVAAGTITKVTATNAPKVYNDLIVSKDVTHPFVNVPNALTAQAFTVVVDLDGEGVANTDFAVTGLTGVTSVHTDADGKFSVQIRDDESFTVKNLPGGTIYTVDETKLPAGYALVTDANALTGTIQTGNPAQAHLVNNYHPAQTNTTLTITGTKTVDDSYGVPYDWTNKSFQFKLESYDPTTGTYTQIGQLQTVTQNGGSYTFGPFTYDTLGTYYYKVSEVIPNSNDREQYMSYDATAGRVVVHVTDNDVDGKLEATVQDAVTGNVVAATSDAISVAKHFVNVYKEDYRPGYLEIPVKKEIVDTHNTGVTAAGFLFGLYKVEGGVTADTPTYTVRTTGADGNAKFHIPFAGPLNETYILKEIIPADVDKIPGMIYDTTEYTVDISVVYDANGVVTRYTVYQNGQTITGNPEFTNTIDLTPAPQQFTVNKTVTGNPPAEDYTFTLTETDGSFVTPKQDGVTDTVKINGDGSKAFDEITYNAVGTHYYVVKETPGSNPGITYDASEYHITVNVRYENGGLVADTTITKPGAGAAQSIDFTNAYHITGTAEVNIHGLKDLDGRELLAGEFQFGLYENGSLVGEAVKNATNGKFSFPTITYTEPGTHTYTVKEIIPDDLVDGKKNGITYDPTVYTVKVEVTDNGVGGLNVKETISLPNASVQSYDDLIFANTYEAASVSKKLEGTKTWFDTDAGVNKALPDEKFSFSLYKADEHYNQDDDVYQTGKNDVNGKFSISLTYNKIGTYYYVLRENMIKDPDVATYDPTVAYDAGRYLIKDVVTDDGVGKLHVLRTIVKDGVGDVDAITFGNLYTPVATEYAISGTKNLTGRNLALQDGEFTFELYEPGNAEPIQSVQNVGSTFTFDAIPYDKSGTYTYKVVEKLPDGHTNGVKNGITYDRTEYTYTVKVEDVNGQLTVTETSHTPAQLVFTNTYAGAGTHIAVSGTKAFNKAMVGGEFTFELYEGNNLLSTQTNGAGNGTAGFTFVIPLETEGEHTFTLKERNGGQNLAGVAYSNEEYTIKVNVTDDNNGQLVAGTPVITKGGSAVSEIKFQNSYSVTPVTDAKLQITKKLAGRNLNDKEFSFQLYKGNEYIMQAQNDRNGVVTFSGIRIETPGTHIYTIKEFIPADAVDNVKDGVTYTTKEITATVEVVDNGDGTLSVANVQYTDGGILENSYAVSGPATFDLEGTKVMRGRKLNADDVFTFLLKDAEGKTVATAKNSGDTFKFEGVELNALGDYYFKVVEKAPAGGVKDGVTYSTQVYNVFVRVEDNALGKMVAGIPIVTVSGAAEELVFINTYEGEDSVVEIPEDKTPDDKTVELTVKKTVDVLSGDKEISPKGFKFKVADGKGKAVATLTANAEGNAAHILTFTAEDIGKTFTYEITEIDTKKPGITYSDAVYEMSITVGQAKTGELTTAITVNGKAVEEVKAVFRNTYEAPELPQTGDDTSLVLYAAVMALSALGFVAMLALRKKEQHAN